LESGAVAPGLGERALRRAFCGQFPPLSHVAQASKRFQYAFDLLEAFGSFATEVGREGFSGCGGVGGEELADERDLLGEAVGPRRSFQVGVFRFQRSLDFRARESGLMGGQHL
jgi:hypothetical protein